MFEAFRLKGTIGRDMSMDLDDTLATKKALQTLGHFRTPSYGLTEYPDQAMIDGLTSFQRAHGLRVDGVMRPNGPTAKKLDAALVARRHTTPPRPSKGATPAIVLPRPSGNLPLVLKRPLKASASADLDDAMKVKTALAALGLLRRPKDGVSPYPDRTLFDAVEAFQRQAGLRIDGEMAPDGPTVRKINAALRQQQRAAETSPHDDRMRLAVAGEDMMPGNRPQILEGSGALGLLGGIGTGIGAAAGQGEPGEGLREIWEQLPESLQRGLLTLGVTPDTEGASAEENEGGGGTANARASRTQIADPLPPVPPSRPPKDHDRPPNKTTSPRPRPDDLGPPTEIFPEPEERWEYIESFPDQSDLLLDYLIQENSRGDDETQADNDFIVKEMGSCLDTMGLRWTHTHGAHDDNGKERKERYIRPTAGIGAARPDISIEIEDDEETPWYEDFQTVTTWKDGETLVARERRAMTKIIDLKTAHKERGAVKAFPKSRGVNRPQWEKEMRKAVWEYCEARYRRLASMMKGRGPAGTSR